MLSRGLKNVIRCEIEKAFDQIFQSDEYSDAVDWFWPDDGTDLIADAVITMVDLIAESSVFTKEEIQ